MGIHEFMLSCRLDYEDHVGPVIDAQRTLPMSHLI